MIRPASLYSVIALSGMVFGAEIVASHVTQSSALLFNAYHMLYNILSLLLLVVSHRMSKGKTLKNTFGWVRLKVLGMLVNMLFLCALCFAALVEAIQTVVHAAHEDTEPRYPWLILCLGVACFLLNIICFVLIGGYTHHQGCSMITKGNDSEVECVLIEANTFENTCTDSIKTSINKEKWRNRKYGDKSDCGDHKLLDLTRDMSSCLAAIACAIIVLLFDGLLLKYVDSILTASAVVVLLATTYSFIRESGLILLQSIPNHIDVDSLTSRMMKEFPMVQNVHDLHVWRLTVSEIIATVHIILSAPSVYISISSDLKKFFENEGISMVTIQPEFHKGTWSTKNNKCILQCSTNNNCGALTCCGPLTTEEKTTARFRCVEQNSKSTEINHGLNNAQTNSFIVPTHHSNTPETVPHPNEFVMTQYDFEKFNEASETTL